MSDHAPPAAHQRLIERLAGELRPVRPRSVARDAAAVAALCAAELALFFAGAALRGSMPPMMPMPRAPMPTGDMAFWWKLASLAAIAAASGAAALRSLRPPRHPRRGLRAVLAILAVVLATGWLIDAAGGPPGHLIARLDWRGGLSCVVQMAILSVPPLAVLAVLLRRGAPTDMAGSSTAAGLAAAAFGAFVFAFACPSDDPFYLAVWYAVGVGGVTVLARWLLPVLARW